MQLRTKRLLLKSLELTDIEDIFNYIHEDNENISHFIEAVPLNYTLQNAEDFVKFAQQQLAKRIQYIFGIIIDQKVRGIIDIGQDENGITSFGYSLAIKYRGNGYITEAANRIITFGFLQFNTNAIYSIAKKDNYKSINVIRRIGMIPIPNCAKFFPQIRTDSEVFLLKKDPFKE